MDTTMIILAVIIIIILAIVLYLIRTDIMALLMQETELKTVILKLMFSSKRRNDLIPNLVETVKRLCRS